MSHQKFLERNFNLILHLTMLVILQANLKKNLILGPSGANLSQFKQFGAERRDAEFLARGKNFFVLGSPYKHRLTRLASQAPTSFLAVSCTSISGPSDIHGMSKVTIFNPMLIEIPQVITRTFIGCRLKIQILDDPLDLHGLSKIIPNSQGCHVL